MFIDDFDTRRDRLIRARGLLCDEMRLADNREIQKHYYFFQGLIISIPHFSKSDMFHVAKVAL